MSSMNLSPAEGWRPDDGAVLVGTVTRVDAAWSDYIKGYYPLVVVAPEDATNNKEVAVHCFHDILRKRMLLLKPRTGERIGIKYHGQTESADGLRKISQYTVKIEGRDADADVWGAMTDPTPREPAQGFTPRSDTDTDTSGPGDDDIPF